MSLFWDNSQFYCKILGMHILLFDFDFGQSVGLPHLHGYVLFLCFKDFFSIYLFIGPLIWVAGNNLQVFCVFFTC